MKIHLNFTALESSLIELEKQSVTVGILNNKKSYNADYSRALTTLSTLSGSTPKRYVKRKRSENTPTLRFIANILEKKRGIFSKVLELDDNRDLVSLCQDLVKLNKTPEDIRRLENSARALVRNPILLKSHGTNAVSTQKRKGFDMYGLSTGTLFKNIHAKYKKW